ncbi:MAG: lipoyl synthase [Chlamydiia bacterium]|nr:lipoyl synthase [Chlamydiia bacterium]
MGNTLFNHKPHAKRRLNILPDNPEDEDPTKAVGLGRFPSWLHRKLPRGKNLSKTHEILSTHRLPTVCEEAKCPNLLECYSKKTATFLALGSSCTRACGFCEINFSKFPPPPQNNEPSRLATSVRELDLKHVVITMVARDDLEDGGAFHIKTIIEEVRRQNEGVTIEVLSSDFSGNKKAVETLIEASPEIFNHNIETVRSLTPRVRHKATYDRTLSVLTQVASSKRDILVKSGLMVGLGESDAEIKQTMQDLAQVPCNIITLGQYLQPGPHKLRVKRFVSPKEFENYATFGRSLGIKEVYAGPFVRSSYNAKELFEKMAFK